MHNSSIESLEMRLLLSAAPLQPSASTSHHSVPSTLARIIHSSLTLSQASGRISIVTVAGKSVFASGNTITEKSGSDVYSQDAQSWIAAPSIPNTDGPLAAVAVNDLALFASPSGDVNIFNPSTNSWSTTLLSESRDFVAAIGLGNKAFFFEGSGGGNPDNRVDVYNSTDSSWSVAHLSSPRSSMGAAAVDGKAIFAGGTRYRFNPRTNTSSNVVTAAVDIFDAKTARWSTARLSQARTAITVATVGTKAIFAGGELGSGYLSSVIDIYDAATGRWTVARLSERRTRMSSTVVGTKVFFAGGEQIGGAPNNRVDIYDSRTGKWSVARLTGARDQVISVGSKAIFAGGLTIGGSTRDQIADIYDTRTGLWSRSQLSVPRNYLTSASMGTQAFFAGGFGDGGGTTSAIDIYTDNSPSAVLTGHISAGTKAANVSLTNTGDAALPGPFTIAIYATTTSTLNSHAILIGHARINHPLAPGQTIQLKANLNLPKSIKPGHYNLIAAASPGPQKQMTVFATQQNALTV